MSRRPEHPYEGQAYCDDEGRWWEYIDGGWVEFIPDVE